MIYFYGFWVPTLLNGLSLGLWISQVPAGSFPHFCSFKATQSVSNIQHNVRPATLLPLGVPFPERGTEAIEARSSGVTS